MALQEKREAIINHYLKTLSDDELMTAMGYQGHETEWKFQLQEQVKQRSFNRNILYRKLSNQILDSEIENLYKNL